MAPDLAQIPSFHKLLHSRHVCITLLLWQKKNSSAVKKHLILFFKSLQFLLSFSSSSLYTSISPTTFLWMWLFSSKKIISLEEPFNILSFVSRAAIIKERLESYIVSSCALFTRPNNNISLGFWLSRDLSTVQHLMNIKGGSQQQKKHFYDRFQMWEQLLTHTHTHSHTYFFSFYTQAVLDPLKEPQGFNLTTCTWLSISSFAAVLTRRCLCCFGWKLFWVWCCPSGGESCRM